MERMNQTLVLMMSFHLRDGQQAHRRYEPLRRSSTCAAALLSLQLPLAAMTKGFDALRGAVWCRKDFNVVVRSHYLQLPQLSQVLAPML